LEPNIILIYSDDFDLMKKANEELPGKKFLCISDSPPPGELLLKNNVKMRQVSNHQTKGVGNIRTIREIIVSACAEGLLQPKDKVLCAISGEIGIMMFFNVQDLGIESLGKELGNRIDLRVIEALIGLSTKIIKEGREGNPAGALFIVGDTTNTMQNTVPRIMNPYEGQNKAGTQVLKEENWNTIKEFAQMDGASIVDDDGYVIAAGRYVITTREGYLNKNMEQEVIMNQGLGGRHLAAMAMSKTTKAICVVVSAEGTVRIFKDGKIVYNTQKR